MLLRLNFSKIYTSKIILYFFSFKYFINNKGNRNFFTVFSFFGNKLFRYYRVRYKFKRFNVLFYDLQFQLFTFKLYVVKLRYNLGSLFSFRSLKILYLFFFINNVNTHKGFRKLSLNSTLALRRNKRSWLRRRNPQIHRFAYISSHRLQYQRRLLAFQFGKYSRYQYRLTVFFLSLYRLNHSDLVFYIYFKLDFFLNRLFRINQESLVNFLITNRFVMLNFFYVYSKDINLTFFDFISLRISLFLIFNFSFSFSRRFFLPRELFRFFFFFRKKKKVIMPKMRSRRQTDKIFRLKKLTSFFGLRFVQVCFRSFSFIFLLFGTLFSNFFINNFLWRFFPTSSIRPHNWKHLS